MWHHHWYFSHYDNKHLTYRIQIGHIEEELREGVRNSNVVDCGRRKTTLERSNCKPRKTQCHFPFQASGGSKELQKPGWLQTNGGLKLLSHQNKHCLLLSVGFRLKLSYPKLQFPVLRVPLRSSGRCPSSWSLRRWFWFPRHTCSLWAKKTLPVVIKRQKSLWDLWMTTLTSNHWQKEEQGGGAGGKPELIQQHLWGSLSLKAFS